MRYGEQLKKDIALFAPSKWTGRAKSWWTMLPDEDRANLSSGWDSLLAGIREQFLDNNWVNIRTKEFKEMRFQQKGHTEESPLDFIQQRNLYHMFLYDEKDGPAVIAQILCNQPPNGSPSPTTPSVLLLPCS